MEALPEAPLGCPHSDFPAREQLAVELSKAEGEQLAIGNLRGRNFKSNYRDFDVSQVWKLPDTTPNLEWPLKVVIFLQITPNYLKTVYILIIKKKT